MPKRRLVAVIPAAGKGSRIARLPCPKELLPIGMGTSRDAEGPRQYPKPVSEYLIDGLTFAGVEEMYMVISEGKWEIPRYYGDGHRVSARIAYLVVEHQRGMPYSINQAYPWVKDSTVLFGMPDSIFHPREAFSILLTDHQTTGADLTLGLFPCFEPHRFGMVSLRDSGDIARIVDKPATSDSTKMWGIACWEPRFSTFIDHHLHQVPLVHGGEIVLGDVFQAALDAGLAVRGVDFPRGNYIDVGDVQDLARAMKGLAGSGMPEA